MRTAIAAQMTAQAHGKQHEGHHQRPLQHRVAKEISRKRAQHKLGDYAGTARCKQAQLQQTRDTK